MVQLMSSGKPPKMTSTGESGLIRPPKEKLAEFGLVDEDGEVEEARYFANVNADGKLELTFVDEDLEPIEPVTF